MLISSCRCPLCNGHVTRIHRRLIDRIVSLVLPVQRYQCHDCQWQGNINRQALKKNITEHITTNTHAWFICALVGACDSQNHCFVVLLALLWLTGKHQVVQLAPTNFVLLFILPNAVQNSMNARDNSLVGGLRSAITFITLSFIVSKLVLNNKKVKHFIEGRPQTLIQGGILFNDWILNASITHK